MAINGLMELMNHLGWPQEGLKDKEGVKAYLRNALSECIFFSPEIVIQRNELIVNILRASSASIDKYKDTKNTCFLFRNGSKRDEAIPPGVYNMAENGYTKVDEHNNDCVKRVIKQLTNLRVSLGRNSDILNYNVCHIWGQTNNPIMLTSLWNVILVPAYKAGLTDKSAEDEKMVVSGTIKTIVRQIYDLKNLIGENSSLWQYAKVNNIPFNVSTDSYDTTHKWHVCQETGIEIAEFLTKEFADNPYPFKNIYNNRGSIAIYTNNQM